MLHFSTHLNRVLSLISFRTLIMLCNAVLNLILLRVIVETLGAKEAGIYFVLLAVGQIVSSLDLGLSYRAAIVLGSMTTEFLILMFLRKVVAKVIKAQLIISILSLGVMPFLNLILFGKFGYYNASVYLVVSMTSCFLSVFSVFSQALIVRAELHRLLAMDFWRGICTFVLSVLFISHSKSIFALILAWALANILPSLILIHRYFPNLFTSKAENLFPLPIFPFLTKEGLHNQFTVVGGVLNNATDQVILSAILGPSFVTSYQILTRALIFLKAILGIIWLQLWPLLTFENQNIRKRKEARLLICIAISVGLFFSVTYSLFGDWFVRALFSQSSQLPFTLYLAVGVFGLILALEIVVSAGSMDLRFQRIKQWLVFASGLTNLVLSTFLVTIFGISGCIISSIITMSILYIFPLGYLRRDFWKSINN